MPDFADLIFTIDTTDLVKSQKFINNVIASAKKLGITVEQTDRKVAASAEKRATAEGKAAAATAKSAAATERAAKQSVAAKEREQRAADRASRAIVAEARRRSAAEQQQIEAYKKLKASIDPAYHAELAYEQAVQKVNRALQLKAISEAEAIRMMALAEAQTLGAGEANNILSNNLARFGLTSRQARGNVQQLSYQVQDLFITMQAGQPLLVILAQQGSQIASIFGPKGAIAGAVLSLGALFGTGLLSYLGLVGEEAQTTEEIYGDLARSFENTKNISDALKTSLDNQRRGLQGLSEEATLLLETMLRLGNTSAAAKLQEALATFGGVDIQSRLAEYAGARGPLDVIAGFQGQDVPDYVRQRMSDPYFQQPVEFGLNFPQLIEFQRIVSQISGQDAPSLARSFAAATAELERQGLLTSAIATELDKIAQEMGFLEALTENQNEGQIKGWNEYYRTRLAGLEFLRAAEARGQAAYVQYYQSRVSGAQFLANLEASNAAANLAAWNRYYQSRIAAQSILAAQEATRASQEVAYRQYFQSLIAGEVLNERNFATARISAWNQYYQSRVTGEQFLANTDRINREAALTGWNQYYQSRITAEAYLQAAILAQTQALADQYAYMASTRTLSDEQIASAEALLAKYEDQAEMARIVAEFGYDSKEAAEARIAAELEVLDAQLATMDVSESMKEAIRDAAEEALRLAEAANGVDLSGAVSQAEALARRLGMSVAALMRLQAIGANVESLGLDERGSQRAVVRDAAQANTDRRLEELGAMWDNLGITGSGSGDTGGGGGDTGASDYQKTLDALKEEIELIGLNSQARRLQQELQRAGVEINSAEGQAIADLVEQMHSLQDAADATEESRQRMVSFFDSLGAGLADIVVEGKSAREVLADLWKQMAADLLQSGLREALTAVFAPEQGSTSGFLSLLGSFFNFGGSAATASVPVESFDGGGATKKGPRVGGIDGKGGYMAMVHPNEQIVDLTQSEASVPSVVSPPQASQKTQITIDVSGANGDDAVRQIAYEATSLALREHDKSFNRRVRKANSDPYGA